MWLSRFSRKLASWRANGINSEISAERSPRFRSCNSCGTELLIPTPSSAVSHIKGLPRRANWNDGELEYWSVEAGTVRNPLLHHSTTPSTQSHRQFFFTQSTIS